MPLKLRLVEFEVRVGNDDFFTREPLPRPDTKPCEKNSHQADIKFQGKIADEETVFDELQNSGQRRHRGAVKKNSPAHPVKPRRKREARISFRILKFRLLRRISIALEIDPIVVR